MIVDLASLGVARVKKRRENGDAGNPNTDSTKLWEAEVRVGLDDYIIRREVFWFLQDIQEVWSGRLGKIGAAEHGIELIPGAKPIY